MSFTGRVRNYGRLHGAIGAGFSVFLVLFLVGLVVVIEKDLAAVGEYGWTWVDVFTHAATIAFLIALIAAFVVGCIWYSITTDKQCDEWDATSIDLLGRYYIDESGNRVSGSLTHYDYGTGCVWEEWYDRDGLYNSHTIRKLTRAELRENDVLTKCLGTGRIQYHE